MKYRTYTLDRARWTADAEPLPCPASCGRRVHLLRRGPLTLLPSGHQCPGQRAQRDVLRTARLLGAIGHCPSDAVLSRQLDEARRMARR